MLYLRALIEEIRKPVRVPMSSFFLLLVKTKGATKGSELNGEHKARSLCLFLDGTGRSRL
jgi:hypothetical protein